MTRHYLWPDNGPRRIKRGINHKYPQFAGQRIRRVECVYEFEGDALRYHAQGRFFEFDKDGRLDMRKEVSAMMDAAHGGAKADGEKSRPMPRLAIVRAGTKAKKQYEAGHTWEPSKADRALIEADLFGHKRIPLLRSLS